MSSKKVTRTSDGLRDFLIRQGVVPTMNRKKDVEVARKLLPISHSQYLREKKEMFNLYNEVIKSSKNENLNEETKNSNSITENKSMEAKTLEDVKLLRLEDVVNIVFYSRSSIYRLMDEGKFPKPVRIGGRSVFWVQSEIIDFMQNWINQPR